MLGHFILIFLDFFRPAFGLSSATRLTTRSQLGRTCGSRRRAKRSQRIEEAAKGIHSWRKSLVRRNAIGRLWEGTSCWIPELPQVNGPKPIYSGRNSTSSVRQHPVNGICTCTRCQEMFQSMHSSRGYKNAESPHSTHSEVLQCKVIELLDILRDLPTVDEPLGH